ncbi:MAG: SDR family NAD(P)-dependent oxidoreductase [Pseudomonadota bacterium]
MRYLLSTLVCLGLSVTVLAEEQKSVLVTGASSGIGLNITEHLVDAGYHVYATARKDADLQRLDAMENVTAIRLDVTVQSQVDAAAELVASEGRGLWGVVNNAGVARIGRMSEVSADDIAWIHDINVLGPHRVNLAFLPMLKESGGRTVTISSINGFVSGARAGAYSMSKFAVESYTEALADDLAEEGVSVGVVNPGAYKSKIREKVGYDLVTGSQDTTQTLTDEQKAVVKNLTDTNDGLKEPDEVSEAVLHFMGSDQPHLRYLVAPTEESAHVAVRVALQRALTLNADQTYEFTRDELVAALDEMLEESE